jgi:hypothetical protein
VAHIGSVQEGRVSEFWEKYKDPRWQRRRLEVMQNAGFCCEGCGSTEKTLNVHHKFYRRGRDPWQYNDFELMCLCEDCHEIWHWIKDAFNNALQGIGFHAYREVVGYAIGVSLRSAHPDTEVFFKSEEGKRGIAKALDLSDADLRKACGPDGFIPAGKLQELYQRPRKKRPKA